MANIYYGVDLASRTIEAKVSTEPPITGKHVEITVPGDISRSDLEAAIETLRTHIVRSFYTPL